MGPSHWVHLIEHPARGSELSSGELGFATTARPGRDQSVRKLGGWSSWVLVAGPALKSRSARASQLDTCNNRTTLPDRLQAVCAAGITGSWSVEQGAGLTPLARWFPSWLRAVPDRLAQTSQSFGERRVSNLHRAPPPSRRTADCPLARQHRPMYGYFWFWVKVLPRMARIGFRRKYRLGEWGSMQPSASTIVS